jgi:IclR family transcriptional regulator, acetate operon repressor
VTTTRRNGGVQSVERALDVLDALTQDPGEFGVSELAEATGLPLPTIHRLLSSIVEHGYARQDPGTKKYALGSKALRLGDAAGRMWRTWFQPYLQELGKLSGETCNLAVLEQGYVVYVAQVQSKHRVRMFTEVGNRVLPHSAAVGKVLLAHRPREFAEQVIDMHGLPYRTEHTITDRDAFREELDRVLKRGYALDNEEEEIGVRCVAVPVHGIGESVLAVSVSGPASRMTPQQCEKLVPEMRRIAANASAAFAAAPEVLRTS